MALHQFAPDPRLRAEVIGGDLYVEDWSADEGGYLGLRFSMDTMPDLLAWLQGVVTGGVE